MSDSMAGQVRSEAAELYERFFVPALFDQWPPRLLDLGGVGVGDTVLDIACGTGVLTRAAKSRIGPTGTVQGVDLNPGMLSVAARTDPDITWVHARAEKLPMPAGMFDRVLCQFGLMFFSDRHAALSEMARVVRPRGRVCVATWAGLSQTPGYAAMVTLPDDLFGGEPAQALAAPFRIGTPAALRGAVSSCFDDVEVHRLEGTARFPSVDAWVSTDVRAWTLRDMLDDDQFDTLRTHARTHACVCVSSATARGVSPSQPPPWSQSPGTERSALRVQVRPGYVAQAIWRRYDIDRTCLITQRQTGRFAAVGPASRPRRLAAV